MALYNVDDKIKIITNVAKTAGVSNQLGTLTPDTDLSKWASPMLKNPYIFNQFINTLLEVFVFKATENNMFKSAFDVFREKRDDVGRGTYETVVDPILPLEYDMTAFDRVLKFYPTNVKAQYFAINRREVFPQTIVRDELRMIFNSWDNFDKFLEQLLLAIPNGNVLIENSYCKELLNTNIASGAIKSRVFTRPTTKEEWYGLAQQIQSIALGMCAEPTDEYNNYANLENGDGTPVYAQSRRDDLVFIGDKDIISGIKTYVLTTAFQEEHVNFKFKFVVLNDTGYREYNSNTREFGQYHKGLFSLIICDGGALKLEDNYEDEQEDYNIFTRGLQRAVHVNQTYGIRAFRNIIAFVEPDSVLQSISADKNIINLNTNKSGDSILMTAKPDEYNAEYKTDIFATNMILVDSTSETNGVYTVTDLKKYANPFLVTFVNNDLITIDQNSDDTLLINLVNELKTEAETGGFTINENTLMHFDYNITITEINSGKNITLPVKMDLKPFSSL